MTYVFAVAPNPHTIYPEDLPGWIHPVHPTSCLDALVRFLNTQSHVLFVDLRPTLLAAKPEENLYTRTDTHWNDLGAYYAYRDVFLALEKRTGNRSLAPRPLTGFRMEKTEAPGGDLARMLALAEVLRDEALTLVPLVQRTAEWPSPTHSLNPSAPRIRALVIGDSYVDKLKPFISEHFGEVQYVTRDTYNGESLSALKPTVVIEVIAERRLIPVEAR